MKNNLAHLRPQKMAPEKNITVIQCPGCQTKFAVDSTVITTVDEPRFHCSRCDNVFAIDKNAYQPLSKSQPPVAKTAEKIDAPQPQFTFDWKQTKLEESDDSFKMETPDFEVSVMKDKNDDEDLTPISDDELGKELFAGLDLNEIPKVVDEPMGYGTLTRNSPRDFSTEWDQTDKASPLTPTSSGIPVPAPRALSYWRNLWNISTPIVAYAAALCGICILSYSNPKMILAFSEKMAPYQETAAPPEVYIRDTSVKQVNLDTGETVSVVSGKIINESPNNFSEVMLEGILFNNDGSIAAKKKINAGSSLGKSRIQALSIQMINDLQESRPAKRFELRAGQEYDFTMVIPQQTAEGEQVKPEFFNSRIYSVKPL